jgi:hypothetical protein
MPEQTSYALAWILQRHLYFVSRFNAPLAPVLRGEGLGVRGFALSITIAIACTVMLGCCGCEPNKPASEDYTPHAAVTLGQNSIDSNTPTPSPKPSDGKCKNCKGVGKVGDGRTMLTCDVCKGTGKDTKQDIDLGQLFEAAKEGKLLDPPLPQVCDGDQCFPEGKPVAIEDDPEANVVPTIPFKPIEPAKPITPTITVYSSPSCEPCKTWKAIEAPKFRAVGWTIKEEETSTGKTPRFEVVDCEHSFSHTGYMTIAQFTDKFNRSKTKEPDVFSWAPGDGKRPSDMPPKRQDGREFDGGPEFGNGSWAQKDEDGVWRRNGG